MVGGGTRANRAPIFPSTNHLPNAEDFMDVSALGVPKPDFIVLELEMERRTISRILSLAREAGIKTLLNPAPAHYLSTSVYKGITHLVVNETEAAIMSGKPSDTYARGCHDWNTITDYFLDLGVKNVVVTLEDEGAFFLKIKAKSFSFQQWRYLKNTYLIQPVQGMLPSMLSLSFLCRFFYDSHSDLSSNLVQGYFCAAYAIEYLRQKHMGHTWDPELAVKHANRAAGMIIQKIGCQGAIPWASDFEEAKSSNITPKVESA